MPAYAGMRAYGPRCAPKHCPNDRSKLLRVNLQAIAPEFYNQGRECNGRSTAARDDFQGCGKVILAHVTADTGACEVVPDPSLTPAGPGRRVLQTTNLARLNRQEIALRSKCSITQIGEMARMLMPCEDAGHGSAVW
jgi:hypothetical protein